MQKKNYNLNGRKIFISGGTGFFGRSLLDTIDFSTASELCLLTRNGEKFLREYPEAGKIHCLRLLEGDVRNFAFPAGKYDYIIHGAASASLKQEKEAPDEMVSTIRDGTIRVLDFARTCRAERMLFISSGAVYGKFYAPVREDAPTSPETPYGKAKLASEQLCLQSGIPCIIGRFFTFYGRHLPRNSHFAIENFLRQAAEEDCLTITGDGKAVRSYLDADDLANWIMTLLLHGRTGEIYNVGSPEAISIKELAERLSGGKPVRILGKKSPLQADFYVPDVSKAARELHLSCKPFFPNSFF